MTATVCPYLGLIDDAEAHLSYASFENRCYATVAREAIPLSEQAVFCLGGRYRSCPRFMALHGAPQPEADVEMTPLPLPAMAAGAAPPPVYGPAPMGPIPAAGGRDWSMAIILGGILLGVFLCIGGIAGYFSLQALVTTTLPPTPTTLPLVLATPTPTLAGPPVLVATPTPPPDQPPATDTPVSAATPTPPEEEPFPTPFPEAETPTPIPTSTPFPQETPVDTPTRRPPPTFTPAFTSTPFPTSTPVFTPTPGALSITFTASKIAIAAGECVTVSWNVQNATSVLFEQLGVAGVGSREECPTITTTYTLTVTDRFGSITKRTLTITVSAGTPTVTPTASITFTPWPTPTPTPTLTPTPIPTSTPTPTITPTYTPTPTQIPTLTPTPFFAEWTVQPASYNGSGPDVGITFTNRGSGYDNLNVSLSSLDLPAGWSVVLCNGINTCGSGVGTQGLAPGEGETVTVRFTIPADTPPGSRGSAAARARSVVDPSLVIEVPIVITR